MIYTGTAGWTIPAQVKDSFPREGTHLERYARVFNAVEINSSFYRDHKRETYEKWAACVPDHFLFSVKLSRFFIHERRLKETGSRLREVIADIDALGPKWGALLVQLPPSLEFDEGTAGNFIRDLRRNYAGNVLWEPRHPTWASRSALHLLADHRINKVLADPEPCRIPRDLRPSVETVRYLRLHGSPEIYKSRYSESTLARIAGKMGHPLSAAAQTWCIFDNTTYGHATENALELQRLLQREPADNPTFHLPPS